ncbi:hypothetical protein DFH09DRAFT_120881 [Mycena vulgaris]|nr:hypothetical protein DFH09DRAFT_120881 [Mycena vulgaris]
MGRTEKHGKPEARAFGLLLLGIRLRLDGVNLVYSETIKMLYTFPRSVSITGGRPSPSCYFVDAQGDGLFHLGPPHSRLAVPLPRPSRYTKRHAPDTRCPLSPRRTCAAAL